MIWAGVVLLAANLGYLGTFTGILAQLPVRRYDLPFEIPFFEPSAWQIFFLGAGLIALIEIMLRLLAPHYRRNVLGTMIMAIVFLFLGLGYWSIIGPLVIITIGVYILLRALTRRRRW